MIKKAKFKITLIKNSNIGIMLLLFSLLWACGKDENTPGDPIIGDDGRSNVDYQVFFGQTHIYKAEDPNLKFVSNRDALMKLNITSEVTLEKRLVDPASNIGEFFKVSLTLNGNKESFFMTPPTVIEPINLKDPGKTDHSFENSFTYVIDKKWIQPGLQISIDGGIPEDIYGREYAFGAARIFEDLKIGAPNKLILNMFDFKFFGESTFDYPDGFIEELESKLPVSEIELRRTGVVFPELTVPPQANKKAFRISSIPEYETMTGIGFDGDQDLMVALNGSLKDAAGTRANYSLYMSNGHRISPSTGSSGFGSSSAFTCIVMVSNQIRNFGASHGTALHELGHSFSLLHWGERPVEEYPYRGTMHGIQAPRANVHVGPVWGLDLKKMLFIPPTKYNSKMTYKNDPMQGGGTGSQEAEFLLGHFSDFSARSIQDFLESKIEVLTSSPTEEARYALWNDIDKDYSTPVNVEKNFNRYAIKQNTEVITVLVGVSLVTPEATIAYPPIGPYLSGLIQFFDATTQAGRDAAKQVHCAGQCDISIRVVQGGQTKVGILNMNVNENATALQLESYAVGAINFPASDGAITKIEVLNTPDVTINGFPSNPEILDTWIP